MNSLILEEWTFIGKRVDFPTDGGMHAYAGYIRHSG